MAPRIAVELVVLIIFVVLMVMLWLTVRRARAAWRDRPKLTREEREVADFEERLRWHDAQRAQREKVK